MKKHNLQKALNVFMLVKTLIDKDSENFTGKAKEKLIKIDSKLRVTLMVKGSMYQEYARTSYNIIKRIRDEVDTDYYSPTLTGLTVLFDNRELLSKVNGFNINDCDVDSLHVNICDESNITADELKESNRLADAFQPYLMKLK